jgi:hypothetical protein
MSVDFSLHHLPLRPSIGDTLSSLKVSFKVDIRPGTLIDQDYAPPSADVSEPILEFWFWKKLHSQVVSAWSCPHKQRSDGRLLPPRLGIWIGEGCVVEDSNFKPIYKKKATSTVDPLTASRAAEGHIAHTLGTLCGVDPIGTYIASFWQTAMRDCNHLDTRASIYGRQTTSATVV